MPEPLTHLTEECRGEARRNNFNIRAGENGPVLFAGVVNDPNEKTQGRRPSLIGKRIKKRDQIPFFFLGQMQWFEQAAFVDMRFTAAIVMVDYRSERGE